MARLPDAAPPTLMLRLAFWLSRRRFGLVIAPLRTLYTRIPKLARLAWSASRIIDGALHIPTRLRRLIEIHVSQTNGCAFCTDLHRAIAAEDGITDVSLQTVEPTDGTATSVETESAAGLATDLSPAEHIALEWSAAVAARATRDPQWAALREHFDERQAAEITWLAAWTSYQNLLAHALELAPDGVCAIEAPRTALSEAKA